MTTKPDWKVPAAKQILKHDAPHAEWLKTRTLGWGGSDMAVITGAQVYANQSVYKLWESKVSDEDPVEDADKGDLFWFGHAIEPVVAARFTEETGIATRNAGTYQSNEFAWGIANPDKLTADGGILEIKSTESWADTAKDWKAGEVPDGAYVQGQHYLAVTGRSHAWYAAIVGRKVHIVGPVSRDEQLIAEMRVTGAEHWAFVESKTPPPVDLATVTTDELTARHPHVLDPESCAEAVVPEMVTGDLVKLAEVKAVEKDAKEERAAIETRLKATIGNAEYLTIDSRPVARWQEVAGRKSFDKTAALEKIAAERGIEPTKQALKDLEAEFTKQGDPTRRLSIIERKAA